VTEFSLKENLVMNVPSYMQVIPQLHWACVPGNSDVCQSDVNEELLNHAILA
jgi:hypothetical protein